MALLVPHLIDAVSTDADALRRALQTLSPGQISAVLGTGDLKVTTSGGMVSVLAAGKGLVTGSQNVITQGQYGVANDAAVSQTHSTSDPTNPRNDLVGVKLEDAFYAGTNKQATPVIVTGTPAPSPADPTPPANWLPCARVRVNAGASTLGTITDLRAFVFQTFLPGSNGVHWRDAANARDNVQWDDAGLVTLRNGLLIPPTAGGTLAPSGYGSTWVKQDEQTPAGGTVTFAVPSWARLFGIVWSARTTDAASQFLNMTCNGDGAANYSYVPLDILGGVAIGTPTSVTAQTAARVGQVHDSGTTGGAINSGEVVIYAPNVATTRRMFRSFCARNDAQGFGETTTRGFWSNSANAVSSVTLSPGAGNFSAALFASYAAP